MARTQIAVALSALAIMFSPLASAQGRLGKLETGYYVCALPGNAAGAAWIEAPTSDFAVTSASSYSTEAGTGTYLLEGNTVQFTRGPLKGRQFLQVRSGLLQEKDAEGRLGRMRCHRSRS